MTGHVQNDMILSCLSYHITLSLFDRRNFILNEYLPLLRQNRDFRYLWFAQVVSLLGDWFNTIALLSLVSTYSNGSGLALSLFLLARVIPPMFIGPIAGVLIDRVDRLKILIYCNILRTGVVIMFLFATSADRLWIIYLFTFIQFGLSAFFEPGQSAITPALVDPKDIIAANTLSSVTWSTMLALGAVIGGVVAAIFGTSFALVVDALSFALAGWLISKIHYVQPPKAEKEHHRQGSFGEGLRYIGKHPSTLMTMLIKGATSIGNVDALMTIFATQVFIIGLDGQLSLGIMYSAFGVGAVIGPFLLNKINDGSIAKMRRLVFIGFFWAVLGWVLLGLSGSLVMVCLALILRAMGGSANWTYSQVLIQKTVPDAYLGRVFSLDLAFFQFVTVISTIAHGAWVDLLNATITPPLLTLHADWLGDGLTLLTYGTVANNLSLISFGTGVISLIPFVIWGIAFPRMNGKETA
jgi:MFS family permease